MRCSRIKIQHTVGSRLKDRRLATSFKTEMSDNRDKILSIGIFPWNSFMFIGRSDDWLETYPACTDIAQYPVSSVHCPWSNASKSRICNHNQQKIQMITSPPFSSYAESYINFRRCRRVCLLGIHCIQPSNSRDRQPHGMTNDTSPGFSPHVN